MKNEPTEKLQVIYAPLTECRKVWGRFFRHLIESAEEVVNPLSKSEPMYKITFKKPEDVRRMTMYAARCEIREREAARRREEREYEERRARAMGLHVQCRASAKDPTE